MKYLQAKEQEESGPKNRLQKLAFAQGYFTAYKFAKAVEKGSSVSYGTAFNKWDGKAGNTAYSVLLEIARFLGTNSVEDVFDP